MSPNPTPLFRSSGQPGYSSHISNDPRRVHARKREREVQVRFATSACLVQSPEGPVHAKPGDAILTGASGERWSVSKSRFAAKYTPAPPTQAGEDGRYISLPVRVLAVQWLEPFDVLLADGESKLTGQSGDWLVDYGDGSLGVVSQTEFPVTYEILS